MSYSIPAVDNDPEPLSELVHDSGSANFGVGGANGALSGPDSGDDELSDPSTRQQARRLSGFSYEEPSPSNGSAALELPARRVLEDTPLQLKPGGRKPKSDIVSVNQCCSMKESEDVSTPSGNWMTYLHIRAR